MRYGQKCDWVSSTERALMRQGAEPIRAGLVDLSSLGQRVSRDCTYCSDKRDFIKIAAWKLCMRQPKRKKKRKAKSSLTPSAFSWNADRKVRYRGHAP
jgi:hypothetical protein